MLSEALLALRPTTTMHHLGMDSTLPLFNARHLLDGLASTQAVLWAPILPHPAAVGGLLRAASHKQAVIGLTVAPPPGEVEAGRHALKPGSFIQAAIDAAAHLENLPPFFLHVQAPAVIDADEPEGMAVREMLLSCLQAGFTSFGVDLTRCPAGRHAEVALALLEPVLEMELAVAVRLPCPPGSEVDRERRATAAASIHGALLDRGLRPDLVTIDGPAGLGDEAWKLAVDLSALIAPTGLAWTDGGGGPRRWPVELDRVGLRALLGDPTLLRLAPASGAAPDEDRVEALSYMDALEHLDALGATGTAQAALAGLVALCG